MIALPGMRRSLMSRLTVKSMRLIGLGGMYVPGGDATVMMQRPFIGNLLTSDPVRYARNVAVIEAEPSLSIGWPTVAWTDSAFKVMGEMAEPGYPGRIRQPILIIASGQDGIVSTPAIDEFARLRAGSHLIVPGARHELRWKPIASAPRPLAFDAFIPSALVRVTEVPRAFSNGTDAQEISAPRQLIAVTTPLSGLECRGDHGRVKQPMPSTAVSFAAEGRRST
jgi:lysophospholipase